MQINSQSFQVFYEAFGSSYIITVALGKHAPGRCTCASLHLLGTGLKFHRLIANTCTFVYWPLCCCHRDSIILACIATAIPISTCHHNHDSIIVLHQGRRKDPISEGAIICVHKI